MVRRRPAERLPMPLIVAFLLTLLAFLPLAFRGSGTVLKPVSGYSTYSRLQSAAAHRHPLNR